ncbi:MAG: hypothetical protein HY579_07580 [Nitrospinae bacterium]|nr:hypothetical protein [Nitrospinota bacterium]
MIKKRMQDNPVKKAETASNGANPYAHKNKGKNKRPYEKFRPDTSNGSPFNRNKPTYKSREAEETFVEKIESQPAVRQEQSGNGTAAALQIDAFELFCAYHLGIGPNKEFRPANIHEVAKRFGTNPAVIRQSVKDHAMDAESLLNRDFDMALAQLDIQVAPEGIDKTELAKGIYQEFLQAPLKKRDWKKILDEDRQENIKVFGKN